MKKYLSVLSLLWLSLCTTVLLTACSDDDDLQPTPKVQVLENTFTVPTLQGSIDIPVRISDLSTELDASLFTIVEFQPSWEEPINPLSMPSLETSFTWKPGASADERILVMHYKASQKFSASFMIVHPHAQVSGKMHLTISHEAPLLGLHLRAQYLAVGCLSTIALEQDETSQSDVRLEDLAITSVQIASNYPDKLHVSIHESEPWGILFSTDRFVFDPSDEAQGYTEFSLRVEITNTVTGEVYELYQSFNLNLCYTLPVHEIDLSQTTHTFDITAACEALGIELVNDALVGKKTTFLYATDEQTLGKTPNNLLPSTGHHNVNGVIHPTVGFKASNLIPNVTHFLVARTPRTQAEGAPYVDIVIPFVDIASAD